MKQLLYPERKRCRACRRYFGFEVIDRLYCSRKCAGLPALLGTAPLPSSGCDLPRQCRTARWNGGKPKARYLTRADAEWVLDQTGQRSRNLPDNFGVYQCEHCGYWHLGTDRRAGMQEAVTSMLREKS